MVNNLERHKQDMEALTRLGQFLLLDLQFQEAERRGKLNKAMNELHAKSTIFFDKDYQGWYTEARVVIRQLLSDRLAEFDSYYAADPKRKGLSAISYTIQDWLSGLRSDRNPYTNEQYFDDFAATMMRFRMQLDILKSGQRRFDSSLFEIRQLVQASLFDSEIEAARELHRKGFHRPAGILAGVVLEGHLAAVCAAHNLSTRKRNPGISDYNDLMKAAEVLDVAAWRFVQRMGDLRNLCGHNKDRDPTPSEVLELIDGVSKVSKSVT